MTTALTGAIELLDRALGYTRVVLAGVPGADLDRRTPCRDWNLGQLLAHMDDALDAFTEAAGGAVDVPARGWSPAPRGPAPGEGVRAARRVER